ncbi:MAG: carboxypeptidase-like regulatory domain-containing protein, partial [Bacteroidota bacterium]|nr:carboxypeptidase-like regulatory domain-containing protein [Bacteroidota bacterium]
MRKFIFLAFFLLPIIAFGQSKITISGYVKDSLSGETLIGSTISVVGKFKGITSNQFGFYSITLPAGSYQFVCSYV